MESLPKSKDLERLTAFCETCTAMVYLRTGELWEQIETVRAMFIDPVPASIPRDHRNDPPPRLDLFRALEYDDRTIEENRARVECLDWALTWAVERLGVYAAEKWHFWEMFFLGLVQHDPPAEELFGYAHHAHPWLAPEDGAAAHPLVTNLPDGREIVHRAEAEKNELQELIFDGFRQALRPLLDASELAKIERDAWTYVLDGQRSIDVPSASPYHLLDKGPWVIRPTSTTTDAEVKDALRYIKTNGKGHPPAPDLDLPNLDLRDLQCAILCDDYGWSWEQLAQRFRWATQAGEWDDQPRRCESARLAVGRGRNLRNASESTQLEAA